MPQVRMCFPDEVLYFVPDDDGVNDALKFPFLGFTLRRTRAQSAV